MPAIAFPDIRPTGRKYSPGSYPKNEFQALNGATTILRYGNRRSQSELSLEFANISDDRTAEILQSYEDQNAGDNWVTFTADNGLAGAGSELAIYLGEAVSGLRWRYAEPPSVDSVAPGRSTISVKLIGYLDG
jgi:hypothetical protein